MQIQHEPFSHHQLLRMMELFQLLGNVYYDTEGWWWDLINSVDFEILGPLILGVTS